VFYWFKNTKDTEFPLNKCSQVAGYSPKTCAERADFLTPYGFFAHPYWPDIVRIWAHPTKIWRIRIEKKSPLSTCYWLGI
jgi:hypothetical protein